MRILNIKNIIAFVFAWNPKEDERITAYVSYAVRRPDGKYLKTILIKLGFIVYAKLASSCAMILNRPRYVFYPPIDLQSNRGMATIYLGDYDMSPSELGPERLDRTLDTCKELACNLKLHIREIEYIDWDCIYSLEESDKELFGKYVYIVKDDKSERGSLTTEWNSHHHDYLVPSELTKDASEQQNLFADNIAKDITQAIVVAANDLGDVGGCALFVRDPINGNEYTLNITGFDDDGRLLANVVKITKGENK